MKNIEDEFEMQSRIINKVWDEDEPKALSQHDVIKKEVAVCDHSWMNTGMSVQGKSLMVCTKCRETKQTVL